MYWELEKDGCGSEFIVYMYVVLKIAFVCVLMSNFGVDFARYIFQNISVNIEFNIKMCVQTTQPHYNNT